MVVVNPSFLTLDLVGIKMYLMHHSVVHLTLYKQYSVLLTSNHEPVNVRRPLKTCNQWTVVLALYGTTCQCSSTILHAGLKPNILRITRGLLTSKPLSLYSTVSIFKANQCHAKAKPLFVGFRFLMMVSNL